LTAKKVPGERQDRLIQDLATDPAAADLDPADHAILGYALKLTRTPNAMGPEDVEALREHGYGDQAIHDLCAVAAYFAFVNRIADGLGVELE
jgi:uncharacterized peroxidase-related enzyme